MAPRYLKKASPPSSSTSTPQLDVPSVVRDVISDIRQNGDSAVRKYSERFDKWSPPSFKLTQAQIDDAITQCPRQVIDDIKEVQNNVRAFAQKQKESMRDFEWESQPVRFRYSCFLKRGGLNSYM